VSARCPRCQRPLPVGHLGGNCAPCLFGSALGDESVDLPPEAVADEMPAELGDYEILGEIGRGGTSVVYRARQRRLNRIVALKTLHGSALTSRDAFERLQTEAQAVARLDHPHIVPLYEVGRHSGTHFLTLRYFEQGSLAQALKQRRFTPTEAARFLATAARAVHHAHSRGVLHRDLKPSNFLLDEHGAPHIADFGLAKLADNDSSLTLSTSVLGTPAYMAPEQASGNAKEAGTPADIYALGAVLFELLTGRPPFLGKSTLEVIRLVADAEPPRPTALVPGLDRDLEAICLRCLEKDPGRRYASAAALAEDLERWLRHEPLSIRPLSPGERALKWVRRRPVIAAMGTTCVAAILIGFFGVTWQWQRAVAAQRRERQHSYAADIRAAQGAFEHHNRGFAFELLSRYLPAKGEEDLRSADWCYLWDRIRGDEFFSVLHPPMVKSSALAPGGRLLASAGMDGTVRIWEIASGRLLQQFEGNPVLDMKSLSFSPDGRRLAAVGRKGVQIRRTDDWSLERELPTRAGVMEFSHDGRFLVTVGTNLIRWNVDDWTRDAETQHPHEQFNGISCLALNHDASLIAFVSRRVSTNDSGRWSVRSWQVGTNQPSELRSGDGIISLAISPDGRQIASGNYTGGIVVGGFSDTAPVVRFQAHPGNIYGLAFSPDGRLLATGGNDQAIRFWDTTHWTNSRTLFGHGKEVWSLAFSEEGSRLVSSSEDGTAKVWNVTEPEIRRPQLQLPTNSDPLGVLPDEITLVVENQNAKVTELWDMARGQQIRAYPWADLRSEGYAQFAFFPGEATLVGIQNDGSGSLWNLPERSFLGRFELGATQVMPHAISRDRRWLLGVRDTTGLLYDLHKPGPPRRFDAWSRCAAFSPDSRWLAFASGELNLKLWDLDAGKECAAFAGGRGQFIVSLVFSSDSSAVAAGGWDGDIGVWDVATGQRRGSALRGHLSAVHRLAFSEDNQTLISSGNFSTRFWNLKTGQETLHFEDTVIPAPVQLLQTAWRPGKRWLSLFDRSGILTLSPMANAAETGRIVSDNR